MPSGSPRKTCTRVLPRPFQLNAIYMSVKSLRRSVCGSSTRVRALSKELCESNTRVVLLFVRAHVVNLSPLAIITPLFFFLSSINRLRSLGRTCLHFIFSYLVALVLTSNVYKYKRNDDSRNKTRVKRLARFERKKRGIVYERLVNQSMADYSRLIFEDVRIDRHTRNLC